MKNNVDLEELKAMIPSETLREYILKTNWTFTDREKAALLLHNSLPLSEEFTRLRNLCDNTADEVLKEKLTQYLNFEERELQELKENGNREYIYVLKERSITDSDYYVEAYFFDYEEAYEYGLKDHEIYSFMIEKYPIYGTRTAKQYYDKQQSYDAVSGLRFINGEVHCFENVYPDYDFKYFDSYFEVPNPFERGDIVKVIDAGYYGVVGTSQKSWAEDVERRLSRKISYSDHTDILISLSFPDEDGFFNDYGHISPLRLERYQPKPSYEGGNAFDDLLLEASRIYNGDGLLSNMWFLAKEYRKANDRHE